MSYISKGLSRALQSPTLDDCAKLKHGIRYVMGAGGNRPTIRPETTFSPDASSGVVACVDCNWAGCTMTRKSTTGCTITASGVTVHHYSRAQTTVASSSGEAELYALSSGTTETMGVLQFLRECCLNTSHHVTMSTDSTAGKSMASRVGVSKATKHIQLRYLYIQDLVAAGAARLGNVVTKRNLADLHAKFLAVDRMRCLGERH